MPYGPSPDPDPASYLGAGTLEHATEELYKIVPEVNIVHLAITLLSSFIVVFGLYSGLIKERLYIGEAIVATGLGIGLGNYAAGVFAPRVWSQGHHFDELTLELTRVVIALAVFAVGVELPRAYIWRHRRSLAILLGPTMLFGWLVSAGFMYALIPALEFLPALVIAAGVTPTDPILASSVVGKGKFAQDHVPSHIRHILQAESGSNDGAAFPFLYLALFLLLRENHSVGQAIGWWILLVFIYQIVLGVLIGAFVGIVARKLLKFSKRRRLIDRESMVAMYVALALFVTGVTTLCGSDDLLAAFACGTAFAWDSFFLEAIEDSNFSSVIDLLANSAIFVYLGATMPFDAWNDPTLTLTPWRLVLVAILIILFRRIPAIFALHWWIPDIKTKREALFIGHFGPMGVGAIFISTLAASKLPTPNTPPENKYDVLALSIAPITYFIVLSSILVHGLTISFFSLGRRVHSRVTSMTRTWTQASGNGDNEPSWMSRVKRIRPGEDVIINRDDDDDQTRKGSADDQAEKGELPSSSIGSTSGESTSSVEKKKETLSGEDAEKEEHKVEAREKEHGAPVSEIEKREGGPEEVETGKTAEEREEDDNPPENILESHKAHEQHKKRDAEHAKEHLEVVRNEGKRDRADSERDEMKREARYCRAGQTREWRDGRRIIIDRNDGGEVEVVEVDADDSAAKKASTVPGRHIVRVPESAIEEERSRTRTERGKKDSPERLEENAIGKAANKLLKAAMLKRDDPNLTPEERERRRVEREKRDAEIKREAHYCKGQDREEGAGSGTATPRQWIEGDQVVEERDDENVTVRRLTEREKKEQAQQHLAALRALGHPVLALEEKLGRITSAGSAQGNDSSSSGASGPKGKGRQGDKGDLSLTRTERIEPPDSDDEREARPKIGQRPSVMKRMRSAIGSSKSPASGAKSKPSAVQETTDEAKETNERGRSPTRPEQAVVSRVTRSPSPSRSIRFAEINKPTRTNESGRSFGIPRLGRISKASNENDLSMRRTVTAPDMSPPASSSNGNGAGNSNSASIRFADNV